MTQDTIPAGRQVTVGNISPDTIQVDSNKVVEDAPLDIAQDRGLFILTPDRKMQLRILGSVRYLLVFDELELSSKDALNTFEIPTGELNRNLPNYFNGLDQTRLGFEITRSTGRGNVFIRLETDFAGSNGFRIRHAYGQFGSFLLGQTWSLFSQINASPATVDFSGPTGSVVTRTPQIRYTPAKFFPDANLAVGLEYARPELRIPDSLRLKTFQLIPDMTARIDKTLPWGYLQLSGIIPMLSARSSEGKFILRPGYGLAVSAVVNSWANGKWYLQGVGGRAITRFFNDLGGQGLDILFDAESDKIAVPFAFGFYATYEHSWRPNLYSNFTYSLLRLEKIGFASDAAYLRGHTFHFNTFWDVVEGAKVGLEVIWGERINKSKESGEALRVNMLFYYDF